MVISDVLAKWAVEWHWTKKGDMDCRICYNTDNIKYKKTDELCKKAACFFLKLFEI